MSPARFDLAKTDKEKTMLAVIAAVILIVVYFNFLVRPAASSLVKIVPKVSSLRKDIVSAKGLISNRGVTEKMRQELSKKLEGLEKIFPREREIPRLLESLSKIAGDSGVKILAIKPVAAVQGQDAKDSEIYLTIPIEIEARSGYHELGRFLEKLERGERFIMIDNIEINANPESIHSHDVRLIAVTYALVNE